MQIQNSQKIKLFFFVISSIARREVHDYCVYEIDELYSAEKRSDIHRYVILAEIISLAKIHVFYQLDEFMATVQGTFAEKIFRDLRFGLFTGWTPSELAEYGGKMYPNQSVYS